MVYIYTLICDFVIHFLIRLLLRIRVITTSTTTMIYLLYLLLLPFSLFRLLTLSLGFSFLNQLDLVLVQSTDRS